METLEQKIENLKKDDELKKFVTANFSQYKTLAFLSNERKRIIFKLNKESIRPILEFFPCSEFSQLIGNDNFQVDSSFRVDIDNPCISSEHMRFELSIKWVSGEYDIEIELPIERVLNFTDVYQRKIYDSEYHWFTGYSMKQLLSTLLRSYKFKAEQINWYGGGHTLKNTEVIAKIIEQCKSV